MRITNHRAMEYSPEQLLKPMVLLESIYTLAKDEPRYELKIAM
jgi:hypothetical protein